MWRIFADIFFAIMCESCQDNQEERRKLSKNPFISVESAKSAFPIFDGSNDAHFKDLNGCAISRKRCDMQPNNPLHGLTLEMILTSLVESYGWAGLSQRIDIQCFKNDPSIKSSLKFLRQTPWAREKVENLYLHTRKR
jgi:hypothetical protein